MKNKLNIIAEAGINHNGDINKAYKLIDFAKESGAQFIKFQTFIPQNIVTKYAKTVTYQKNNSKELYQYNLLKNNCLNFSDFTKLYNYAKKKRIDLISSPFDDESLDFLLKLKLKFIKIPSGELTNYFMLKKLSSSNSKVIMSTGMSTFKEINQALEILLQGKLKLNDIILLHCVSNYPTTISQVNLNNIIEMKKKYKTIIGFSDHTLGSTCSKIAISLGAEYIEKHITLNKKLKGPDHKISLNKTEFKSFVKELNEVKIILGNYKRTFSKNEIENRSKSRKSIVAKKNILKNEIFSMKNLTAKRPGNGLSPMKILKILGKKSKYNYSLDDMIRKNEEF